MRFVFRQERRRQSAWAFPSAQEQARAARLATQFEPGVSVSPCARIEVKTHSAARLKIRSAPGKPSPSTSSENAIVATPLGPNQAMNACR